MDVLFCFKSYPIGGLKGLCGTKEIQIPSSWTEPPVEAPQSLLAPSPPYARKKILKEEKRKKGKHAQKTSPIVTSGILMTSSSKEIWKSPCASQRIGLPSE
jgi:hypothetical protein